MVRGRYLLRNRHHPRAASRTAFGARVDLAGTALRYGYEERSCSEHGKPGGTAGFDPVPVALTPTEDGHDQPAAL